LTLAGQLVSPCCLSPPHFAANMKSFFAFLAILALAAAQATCSCRENTGASCAAIFETSPGVCGSSLVACSGCACDPQGSLTCTIANAASLQFNGTGNLCSLETIPVASCPTETPPEPNVETRQCCFSGNEGFTFTCNLAPQVTNIVSVSYIYNVDGLGTFTFAPPDEPLEVIITMTATATPLGGAPAFMTPQVGTNSTQVFISAPNQLVESIPTVYNDIVGSFSSGDLFNYLVANPSFSVLMSATMGESGGDASRVNTLEGCMDFSFVTQA